MSRVAYVNGQFVELRNARVHIEDRGFQFSDGVYEVWGVFDGVLADAQAHFERLLRSLSMLQIQAPMSTRALRAVVDETRRRNRVINGLVYLQVTRGTAPRDHLFPSPARAPTVVLTARPINRRVQELRAAEGLSVRSMRDVRWGRCDIKSVSLLPNVLAKQEAREHGASEAWLVDDQGFVTEGASSTAWIVDRDGRLVTRPLGEDVLPGVTRARLFGIAEAAGLSVVERPFTVEEAKSAPEAFLTSASATVMPVTMIDGASIANGRPGSRTADLRARYMASIAG